MGEEDKASDEEEAALRARLDKLAGALRARRAGREEGADGRGGSPASSGSAISAAFGAAGEFAGAIAVGGLIGWGLDRLFGASPLFLIVFFLLGAVAGVLSLIRATSPKPPPK